MSDASEVLRLPPERFDEVVEALCDAFRDYPVMRYVLKDAGDHYLTHLPYLVGYFTASRFARGWPVLGVERGVYWAKEFGRRKNDTLIIESSRLRIAQGTELQRCESLSLMAEKDDAVPGSG